MARNQGAVHNRRHLSYPAFLSTITIPRRSVLLADSPVSSWRVGPRPARSCSSAGARFAQPVRHVRSQTRDLRPGTRPLEESSNLNPLTGGSHRAMIGTTE